MYRLLPFLSWTTDFWVIKLTIHIVSILCYTVTFRDFLVEWKRTQLKEFLE
jgi:hypothetical protein